MTIYADVQKLEPGAWVELFDLDARSITGGGSGDILHFHGYTQVGPIIWGGVSYEPYPVQAEGFEKNPDQPPTPTFSAGNVSGRITALCLAYQDLVGAKLTRTRTFGKYLDAANFPDGNPTADPEEVIGVDVCYLERKSSETSEAVTWELSSPMDFGERQLPGREIVANVCGWLKRGGYRGPYCGYTGPAVAKIDDTPTSDPSQDACGGRLHSCELRQWPDGVLNYGGYPAAQLIR